MRSEAGFTLVEVLVALVVSGLLLAIMMERTMLARDRTLKAQGKDEAVTLARQLLTEASASPYSEGARHGSESGLDWELREAPVAADPRGSFVLAELSLSISNAGGARLLEAHTRKLKTVER
jgi:prepilin-type N-terminal cleavage/methylation domain-containing protein